MLVDDEELLRFSLEVNLKRKGLEISSAENATTALTILKGQPYDLLLTDYFLEGIDGVELMQQAKELYPKIKVILFSGYLHESMDEEMLRLGADGFMRKPISLDDLVGVISEMMTT